MGSESILAILAALSASALLTPLVVVVAARARLIDVPNARSSHVVSVPRGGGLAVMLAATAVALVATRGRSGTGAVVVGAVILGLVGLVDDRRGLPAVPRLVTQVAVPLACAAVITDRTGWALLVALVVSVVWCVSYVNAFNFMDGINGISGTQAAAAGGFLALVARHLQLTEVELAASAMTGAALGFLPYNAVRPKVFLGDVGSYGIGFWLAACALMLLDHGVSPLVLAGPFVLYLGDTSAVLVRRWRRGESLFEAHREHAYQLLVRSGWSHVAVSSLCLAITLATSAAMFIVVDQSAVVQLLMLAVSVLIVAIYLRFASTTYRLRGGAAG